MRRPPQEHWGKREIQRLSEEGSVFVLGPRVVRWSAGGVAVLVLLSGVATAIVSHEAADRLIHPARELDPSVPGDQGLAYEAISLRTEDGLDLSGWWIPAEVTRGTVIFLHGYGASKTQALGVASFLHDAGYSVLAFDFRAHGESEGDHTTIGIDEARDVRAAAMYTIAREGADLPIALLGWSMGAAAALNAGATLPPQVRAIIVDSGFARLANVVSNNLAVFTGLPQYPFAPLILHYASSMAGHGPGENEPARQARALYRPLLVIQGMSDNIASPDDDGRALAASAGSFASLWLVPNVGHVEARRVEPLAYEDHVIAFLAMHLSDA